MILDRNCLIQIPIVKRDLLILVMKHIDKIFNQ